VHEGVDGAYRFLKYNVLLWCCLFSSSVRFRSASASCRPRWNVCLIQLKSTEPSVVLCLQWLHSIICPHKFSLSIKQWQKWHINRLPTSPLWILGSTMLGLGRTSSPIEHFIYIIITIVQEYAHATFGANISTPFISAPIEYSESYIHYLYSLLHICWRHLWPSSRHCWAANVTTNHASSRVAQSTYRANRCVTKHSFERQWCFTRKLGRLRNSPKNLNLSFVASLKLCKRHQSKPIVRWLSAKAVQADGDRRRRSYTFSLKVLFFIAKASECHFPLQESRCDV